MGDGADGAQRGGDLRPARPPFLEVPGRDRGPGPFSLPSLSEAHGREGYEQEREIYLRAVPNATDDQLETGLGVWYMLSRELGGRSLEDQARIVLAFPFVSQDLILAGGVGAETKRVTDRYPSITLEELRETLGAAAGEIRRGTSGYLSDRASAADARAAIRDMKGATLAALERLHDEEPEAAAAYLEALRSEARQIRTGKASKAELAAVARLIGIPLPSDVDSWGQVKKARVKDLLEEYLEAEVNPVAYGRHGYVIPDLTGAEWVPIPGGEPGREYTLRGAHWVHLINRARASKRNRRQLLYWLGLTDPSAERWPHRPGPEAAGAREYPWALAIADPQGEARVYAFQSREDALEAVPELLERLVQSPAAVALRDRDLELRQIRERRRAEREREEAPPEEFGGQFRLFNPARRGRL